MSTKPSDSRPLDDIDVRVEETEVGAVAERRIEFATFTEGEYVESILIDRARANEIYRDLGKVLGYEPEKATEARNPSADRDAAITETPISAEDEEIPVCPDCGSDNVAADAAARWSTASQDWEVSNIFDKGPGCNNCGAVDFRFAWVTPDKVRRTSKDLGWDHG